MQAGTRGWVTTLAVGMCAVGTPASIEAAVLQVGPGKPYATPSAAIAAASPGDEIEIDAGEYVDDFASITTGDLVIRGVGGMAHLHATVNAPNQKGIWVIEVGTGPITVENVEFSGAKVSAGDGNNGAGIRMQGSALTVRNCYFHDNQNGILSGGTAGHTVIIEGTEFAYNGNPGSGQEHNVYISGDAALLVFRGNYSHHAYSGHTLKSRAQENRILYNRIMDEADGTGSYVIDLPQGGLTYIVGNLLEQGPNAENHGTIVNYKGEGASNDDLHLYLSHNTIVNDWPGDTVFVRVHQAEEVVAVNNLFVGQGTPVLLADPNTPLTEMGNIQTDEPGLVDLQGYDYRLLEGSMAVDAGVEVDAVLVPESHYMHPTALEDRPIVGPPDVGAYELGGEGESGTTGGVDDWTGGSIDTDDTGGADGADDPTGGGVDASSSPGEDGTGATDSGDGRASSEEGPSGCGCQAIDGTPLPGIVFSIVMVAGVRRRSRGHALVASGRTRPARCQPERDRGRTRSRPRHRVQRASSSGGTMTVGHGAVAASPEPTLVEKRRPMAVRRREPATTMGLFERSARPRSSSTVSPWHTTGRRSSRSCSASQR